METIICTKPIGQKVLDAGFKRITDSELRELLHCHEITKMENEVRKQDFLTECNQEIQKLPVKYQNKAKKMIEAPFSKFEYFDSFVFCAGWHSFMGNMKASIRVEVSKVRCRVKSEPIDVFIEDKIPEEAYNKIEIARSLGIESFEVHYPFIEEFKGDPIIIGKLGEHKIFIFQW